MLVRPPVSPQVSSVAVRRSAPVSFGPAARSIATGITGASDVTALPSGSFAIVDDRSDSLFVVDARGAMKKVELSGIKGRSFLEGVAFDARNQRLIVSREEPRELLRYRWDGDPAHRPVLDRRIDVSGFVDGPRNKGLEGLAFLEASASPTGRAQLVAVKEGKPRELRLLDPDGTGKGLKVKLEKQLTELLEDFSAVTVDPATGTLFIASDESSAIAQARVSRVKGELVATLVSAIPVRGPSGAPLEHIEGLSTTAAGDLVVITEDGALTTVPRRS